MDVLSIVILAAVIAGAVLCIVKLRRDKKRGRSGCGGDCGSCRGCEK